MRLEDLPPHAQAEARRILEQQARERAEVRRLATGEPPPENVAALEKETQSAVVKLFRAFGCRVYSLSQARATKQTPGIPDLWVVHTAARLAWWWETKRPKGGRLSPAQVDFAAECDAAGVRHGVGSRADAEAWLIGLGLAVRDERTGTLEPTTSGRAAA